MFESRIQGGRTFQLRDTERKAALIGTPLAGLWQRLLGYTVDLFIAVVVWFPLEAAWRYFALRQKQIDLVWNSTKPETLS